MALTGRLIETATSAKTSTTRKSDRFVPLLYQPPTGELAPRSNIVINPTIVWVTIDQS